MLYVEKNICEYMYVKQKAQPPQKIKLTIWTNISTVKQITN